MKKPKIVIAAGTGYLGKVLIRQFKDNYDIVVLSRSRRESRDSTQYALWDAKNVGDWVGELENADVLINLAGRSVDCRYNQENKDLIMNSRVDSTRVLGQAVEACQNPPKLWINSASATIYRHSLDQGFDETSKEFGSGFSVSVCQNWEKEFFESDYYNQRLGVRKAALRITIVLGKTGGAMKPILRLAKLFLGGRHGPGNQMFSWVHEKDFARAVQFIVENESMIGPVNLAAPTPLPNKDFMKAVRKAVSRPLGFPTPKWLLKIGAWIIRTEPELLLKSRYVIPGKLKDKGFEFIYPTAEEALEEITSKP